MILGLKISLRHLPKTSSSVTKRPRTVLNGVGDTKTKAPAVMWGLFTLVAACVGAVKRVGLTYCLQSLCCHCVSKVVTVSV